MARRLFRIVLALIGMACCYYLFTLAGTAGVARFFSATSVIQSSLGPADVAVKLAPSDPEGHYSRGIALTNLNRLIEAEAEFERAVQLRPYHYYEWLDLGVTLDRLGDSAGSIAAMRESIRLAPFFSQPHWQLGNLLYRQAQYDEAFAELRKGAESNSNLVEGMLDLAWVAADGDVSKFEGFMQPNSVLGHLQMASFLARQGKGDDAARRIAEAGEPRDAYELSVRNQTILILISTRQFHAAYLAWLPGHRKVAGTGSPAQLVNGDFAEPVVQNDPGFGWQLAGDSAVTAAIDPSGPNGARSLMLQFNGASTPGSVLIHQLILPSPNARYSLSFMARAEELVTGGPPTIIVLDASEDAPKILAQSSPIAAPNSAWTRYQVDFSTAERTSAIRIGLQRMYCAQSPCPIFGRLWLSQFTLASR
jgi:tetratricopeptide (TPR) repeat protein